MCIMWKPRSASSRTAPTPLQPQNSGRPIEKKQIADDNNQIHLPNTLRRHTMFKYIAIFFTLAIFTLGSLSAVYADEGPDGNSRKGKYTYRKVIKACHERGEVDSASPQVSPADKKRAEWKAIFENKNFSAFG